MEKLIFGLPLSGNIFCPNAALLEGGLFCPDAALLEGGLFCPNVTCADCAIARDGSAANMVNRLTVASKLHFKND